MMFKAAYKPLFYVCPAWAITLCPNRCRCHFRLV